MGAHKFDHLVEEVTDSLERFDVGVASTKLYDFTWDVFCDWYIELAKSRLAAGGESADGARRVLVYVITGVLQMLHPFMPSSPRRSGRRCPRGGEHHGLPVAGLRPPHRFEAEEADFEKLMNAIARCAMSAPS